MMEQATCRQESWFSVGKCWHLFCWLGPSMERGHLPTGESWLSREVGTFSVLGPSMERGHLPTRESWLSREC